MSTSTMTYGRARRIAGQLNQLPRLGSGYFVIVTVDGLSPSAVLFTDGARPPLAPGAWFASLRWANSPRWTVTDVLDRADAAMGGHRAA